MPILANGVRAWGTIFVAQSQGIEFAKGFDHIFYGWVFFALVIAILLGASWRWFDRDPEEPQISAAAITAMPLLDWLDRWRMRPNRALFGVIAAVLAFGLWHGAASRVEAQLSDRLLLPSVPGWQAVADKPGLTWEPRAQGADRRLLTRFVDQRGRTVDVFLAVYAAQDEDRDVTGGDEGALPPDTPWRWLDPGLGTAEAKADFLLANGEVKRLAQTSFRTGDLTTASATRLKLAVMRDRIALRGQPTMMLVISAEGPDSRELAARLDDFAAAMGDRGAWMDRAAALR